jgi:hypothetical protein
VIEPYGEIIRATLRDFARLKLAIESDSDCQTTLSGKTYFLTISTEKGYQPSILAYLSSNGQRFEIGTSARILAARKFEANMSELAAIKDKYHLDADSGDASIKSSGTYIYIQVAIWQIFDFIAEYGRRVSPDNKPFQTEFLSEERKLMSGLGL